MSRDEEIRFSGVGLLILILLIGGLITVAILGFTTSYSVGVSETAILINPYTGEISGPINGPVTNFFAKAPWTNVVTISTSVQTITLEGNNTGIFVLSKDNLEVEFDVNFRYQISANRAIDLYKKFPGRTWQSDAIEPHIRTAFRSVVALYSADQLQLVKDQIQNGVETTLAQEMGSDSSLTGAVNIVATQITDITLPRSFSNAIQAKLNSQQEFLQASFQAQKVILLAEAQANATIQQALGVKASQLIIANGSASSLQYISQQLQLNQTQTAQLTQTYVFMQQLQALCQQQGAPCQNMILLLGGSNGQIFEIPIKKP